MVTRTLVVLGVTFSIAAKNQCGAFISSTRNTIHTINRMTIVSPFDNTAERGDDAAVATYAPSTDPLYTDEILDLTLENVERVLDEMRPYLIQDGGNVAIQDIDGPVVRLELQVCSTDDWT